MSNHQKKFGGKTPAVFSARGTLGRETVSRSKSFASVSGSSSLLSALSDENEDSNPLEKEFNKYNEEWCIYAIRVLEWKMLRDAEEEREREAKKCLVSLKKEYEQLLAENALVYEKYHKMDMLLKCHRNMEENLCLVRKLSQFTRETDFEESLERIAANIEANANRLQLISIEKNEIERAFANNLMGFDSDIYKLLKVIEEHAVEREYLVPEIVEIIKEIRQLHAENERMKIRCTVRADQLRRGNIVSYYEKYFKMAVKECRDFLEELHADRISDYLTDESLLQRTIEWGDPASSSTPTADN